MRRHDNAKDMTRTQIKGTCTPECTRSDLAPFRGGAPPPPHYAALGTSFKSQDTNKSLSSINIRKTANVSRQFPVLARARIRDGLQRLEHGDAGVDPTHP